MAASHCSYSVLFLCLFVILSIVKSYDSTVELQFIVPTSDELISTTLKMQTHRDVTFYKIIRSLLYYNDIIMDCTFTFDTSKFNGNQPLICDVESACISSLGDSRRRAPASSTHAMKLHLENLGVGDLKIAEIKRVNTSTNYVKSLFYDHLACIGDSAECDGHRYIDFLYSANTKTFKVSPINSQIHDKLQCDPKDTQYHAPPASNVNMMRTARGRARADELQPVPDIIGGASHGTRRQLLSRQSETADNFLSRQLNILRHGSYMDILLTLLFLIMIVISVFNMSNIFSEYKEAVNGKHYVYDTRRV